MSPAEPTGRARGFSRALALLCCLAHLCASTQPAWAAGVPITIFENTDIDSSTAKRIKVVLADRRSVRALRPLPTKTQSPEELANQERVRAIALALKRAEKHEEFAKWDACAKEAGDKLGDAPTVTGMSIREIQKAHEVIDPEVIHTLDDPYHDEGGIATGADGSS